MANMDEDDAPTHMTSSGDNSGNSIQAGYIGSVNYSGAPSETRSAPRELPGYSGPWVDRAVPLSELVESLIGGDGTGHRLVVIQGDDDVGRTSLAVRGARNVEDEHFPGGTFFRDAHEYLVDGAVSVMELLGDLLTDSLEVDTDLLPPSLAGRMRMWRRKTADRRVLLVLDNLEDPAVLDSLLPGGTSSAVIVITRYNAIEFIARATNEITVEKLTEEHALELLAFYCGERVAAEPEEAARLVRRCDGRPNLIRLLGASLRNAPDTSLADFRDELLPPAITHRSDADQVGAEIVAHSLDHGVSAEQRRLVDALLAHPGRDFDTALASWLAGRDANDLLEDLRNTELITRIAAERWRVNEALARNDANDDEGTTRRIHDFYLRTARLCDEESMGKKRLRVREDLDTDAPLLYRPDSAAAAIAWLAAEQRNIEAVQRYAFDRGWFSDVWSLEESLWALYQNRLPLDTWSRSAPLAIEAARLDGDLRAESRMHAQLAYLLLRRTRFSDAEAEARQARELARAAGDRRLEASAVEFRGVIHHEQGEYRDAIECFMYALAENRQQDRPRAVALQHRLIGRSYLGLGVLGEAETHLRSALDGFVGEVSHHHRAKTLANLAELAAAKGDVAATEAAVTTAFDALRTHGVFATVPIMYERCGDALAGQGFTEPAETYWRAAVSCHEETHNGDGEEAARLRAKLDTR